VTPIPEPAPVSLSGDGIKRLENIHLIAGVAVATIHSFGTGPFTLNLFDETGEPLPPLDITTGPAEGSRALVIPAEGAYVFAVTADGQWTIDVSWPVPGVAVIRDVPFQQGGSGSQALYFIDAPAGDYTLAATHNGLGQFAVSVVNRQDGTTQTVIKTEGTYDDSVTFSVTTQPSAYLMLDMRASGDWTVEITPAGE